MGCRELNGEGPDAETDFVAHIFVERGGIEGPFLAALRLAPSLSHGRHGALLHAKTATVDHVWSTVGSSNLDWWTIARNDEIKATILSGRFGRDMGRMFDRDLGNATEMNQEQWKSRAFFERICEYFAGMIQPML